VSDERGLAGNVVRYEIAHEEFGADNPKRTANLDRLRDPIDHFMRIGRGVSLDLQMPIDLDVQSDVYAPNTMASTYTQLPESPPTTSKADSLCANTSCARRSQIPGAVTTGRR